MVPFGTEWAVACPTATTLLVFTFPSAQWVAMQLRAKGNIYIMIRTAVIGYGYWGPRIARNFNAADGCKVVAICDKIPASLQRAHRDFPNVEVTCDFNAVLSSPDIDAVAVVTPVWTHFELAETALKNGKHVFVEKPFTSTSRKPNS